MRVVILKEEPKILEMVDAVAKDAGSNRSVFIREAIREKLGRIMEARGIPKSEQA